VLLATVYIGFSIEVYFLLTSLATLIIVPLSISKIRKLLPYISFLPKLNKAVFMEMLPYSLNIFSYNIFQFSFYNLRPVFLGMEGTLESVTDFRVMNGIIGVVHLLGGAFMPILLPSTSKVVAQKNMNAYYRVAYDGTKYISILLCFLTFSFMAMGPEMLTLYVGEEYLVLIPWFNIWLLCNLGTHNQAISSLVLAGSKIRAITYNTIAASMVGLGVTWALIPYYQVGGTVLGFVAYEFIQLGFYYFYYWPRKMQISSSRVMFYSLGPYVLLGTLAFFVCKLLPSLDNHWMNLVFIGGVFSFIYLAGVLILSNKNDRQFVMGIINKKR
jgi:O-antigen/teichoic acid export membrane protein